MKATPNCSVLRIVVAVFVFLVLLTTCKDNVGLGGTVDINPPKIENIYPPISAVIKDSFVFAVKASDDTGVKHVGILVKSADGEAVEQYLLDDKKGYWSCDIHPQKNKLKDGPYTVEITAQDGSGKEIKAETAFVIDNTPPLLVLNRPSTAAEDPKTDTDARDLFGDVFLLIGQVYDKNPVAELTITAENDDGSKQSSKTLENIPQNIRLKVDRFFSENNNQPVGFYRSIYGTDEKAGKQNFSYDIVIYDNAKEYKMPWDPAATEKSKGNSTDIYYLYDDLYSDVLKDHKIQDVYDMLYGSYKGNNQGERAAEISADKLKKIQAIFQEKKLGGGKRKGTFALNPSIHPRFDIAGIEPTLLSETDDSKFPSFYSESTLTVKLSRNLDEVPLEQDPTNAYRFFLVDWNLYTNSNIDINTDDIYENPAEETLKAGFIRLTDLRVEREGGNYLVHAPISVDKLSLQYGKKYVLLVRGRDKEKHEFRPDPKRVPGGVYGFLLRKNAKLPEVTVIKMNEVTGSANDPDITEPVPVKKDSNVTFKVKLTQATEAELTYTLKLGDTVVQAAKKEPLSGEKEFTLPAELFNQSTGGLYKLVLVAEAEGNRSIERIYYINYDVRAPEITIESPTKGESRNIDNKVLTIKGSAIDLGSGLKAPISVSLKKSDDTPVQIHFAVDGEKQKNGENWEMQSIDLSSLGEGTYTLEVTAEDSLGQKETITQTFIYDAEAPEIQNAKVDTVLVSEGATVYSKTGSIQIEGAIRESYELESFTIGGEAYGSLTSGHFSKTLTLPEGEHHILIKVIDKAGKESFLSFQAVVDKIAPTYTDFKIGGQPYTTGTILASSSPVGVEGVFTDPAGSGTNRTSGIKKVHYKIGNGDWKDLVGAQTDAGYKINGSLPIAMNTDKPVTFKAIDNAGNEKEWPCTVAVSSAEVTLKLTADGAVSAVPDTGYLIYRNAPFNLLVEASSSSSTGAVTVQVKQGGSIIPLTDFFTTAPSITITPSPTPTPCPVKTPLPSDGEYTVEISAGGKKQTLTVYIDTKAPALTPRIPLEGQSLKEDQQLFAVISDLPGVGIDNVTAKLNGSPIPITVSGSSIESNAPLSFNEGDNTVLFEYRDKLGNHASKTINFKYDKHDPILSDITVNGKPDAQVLIGVSSSDQILPFTVAGKVKDTDKMESVTVSVSKMGSSYKKTFPAITKNGSNIEEEWSQRIKSDDLNGKGTYTITVIAKDVAGRTTVQTRTFATDGESPKLTFDLPVKNAIVNKIITIRGTANDETSLASVKVVKENGTELETGSVSDSTGDDATKAEFKNARAYNWSFKLDTSKYPDGNFTLKAIALDSVGNKFEKTLPIKIDQDSDRPVITVTSFDTIANAGLSRSKILTGTISDDDGPIPSGKLKIKVGSGGFESVNLSADGSVWTYTVHEHDGTHTLDFEVTDAATGIFTTGDSNLKQRPKVIGKSDAIGNAKDSNITFTLDNTPPEFKPDGIRFVLASSFTGSDDALASNKVIGNGAHRKASFRVFVKDTNGGIDNVKLFLNAVSKDGVRKPAANADGYEAWDIVDVTLTEGNPTVKIEATDKSGFTNIWQATVIVDFTAPKIAHVSPGLDSIYFNEVHLRGNIIDNPAMPGTAVSGIDADSVEYKIGNSGYLKVHTAGADTLSSLEASVSSWIVKIADISKYKTAGGVISPAAPSDKIYKIPVKVKVTDKAGNSTESEEYVLQFDPEGSTPFVDIITPKNNVTLGGNVLISGLARVANPQSGYNVSEVWLQLNKTKEDLEGNQPWNLDGKEFGSGDGFKISAAASVNYWSYSLPQAVIDAILGTETSKEVYFRVKGKSGATFGPWTSPAKFTISKDVAQFSEIKLNGEPYAPNAKWIRGDDYEITGRVTHSDGIKNDIKALTEGAAPNVQQLDASNTTGWFTPTSDGKGYDFKIKIKTSHYPESSGYIEFDIVATDSRSNGSVRVATKIFLKYDNSVPAAAIGEYIVQSENTDFRGGKFTPTQSLDSSNKEAYRVVVAEKTYTVASVSASNEVTLTDAADLNGSYDYGIVEQPKIIFDDGSAYQLIGITEDSGSGIERIEAELTVKNNTGTPPTEENITITLLRTDSPKSITLQRGDMATFKGSLSTNSISNGKGKLKITVYDGAGNSVVSEINDISVKNSPIKISKLHFATDLSGNGQYEPEEKYTQENENGALNSNRDFIGEMDVSEHFVFKNNDKSVIDIELTDGKGLDRTLKLYKDSISGTPVTSLTTRSNNCTLDLTGKLDDIGDGNKRVLFLVVTDESKGDWFAQMKITVGVDEHDDVVPRGFITPFFYNSDDSRITKQQDLPLVSVVYTVEDNLQTGKKEVKEPLGHIELSGISSLGNAHPCVSGKVKLRGIAYDNSRLKKLELSGAGINGVNATFNNGTWSTSTGLVVKASKFSNTGHYVEWEYEWTTGSPALAEKVSLTVTDAVNKTSGTGLNEPAESTGSRNGDREMTLAATDTAVKNQFIRLYEGEKSYLVQVDTVSENKKTVTWKDTSVPISITKYRLYTQVSNKTALDINIVPYVTALKREARYNTHRSSSGAYNLLRGDTVRIEGFNLIGAVKARVRGEATEQAVSGGTFTLPATAKSGQIEITASGIKAVNNTTNNSKPYNKQFKENRPETNYWTDDVAAHVWKDDEAFEGSNNPKFPSMDMGTDGTLYAAFSNYSKADVYYSQIGTGSSTVKTVFHAYDPPEEAAIAVSGLDTINVLYSANYHGGQDTSWNAGFSGAGGLYCYDKNAKGFSYNGGRLKGKFYRFELFYHNEQLQQFKNFRIARKDNNRIHIVYYDTLANSIKYASVDAAAVAMGDFANDRHEIAWTDIDGGVDRDTKIDNTLIKIGSIGVLTDSQFEDESGFTPRFTRSSGTAEYCAIALDNNKMPIVVYADVDTGTLRLARASSAVPTGVDDWKVQRVLTAAGDPNIGIAEGYFTAKFDTSGYLHIAFRNARGQLCYVKSTNANAGAGASAYTFGKSIIIDDAGSLVDITLDGDKPYISYMSKVNAYDGIRIARYDSELVTEWNDNGTEKTKGGWNVMTAGMVNRASNVRTCIAVAPSSINTWKAAVGYTPGNIYRVVKYIE